MTVTAKIYYPPGKALEARVLVMTLRNIGYRASHILDQQSTGIIVEICGKRIEEDDLYGWLRILTREYIEKGCQ